MKNNGATLASLMLASGLCAMAPAGNAGSLRVTPVTIELAAPAAAATTQLRNLDTRPVNAQVRVFRWMQVNGADKLVETRDVVVSPPFAALASNSEQVLRVVRLSKQPVQGEEAYRLLVDELPDASRTAGPAVNFVVRHSIPVFFGGAGMRPGKLEWSVERKGGKIRITASNTGDRRVRLSALKLSAASGRTVTLGEGLAGYVFGQSKTSWVALDTLGEHRSGAALTITASGNNETIKASTTLLAGR
jgi:fimbrial chaperone protein